MPDEISSTKANASENRRMEYQLLRQEIFASDKACVLMMGFLLTLTGALGSEFINGTNNLAGWIISPAWFLAFYFFTEKRFVIIRNAAYIREQIEPAEDGLNWEKTLNNLAERGLRKVLPFDVYHLELFICGFLLTAVPILGSRFSSWAWNSNGFYFISSLLILAGFSVLAAIALRQYGNPQRFSLNPSLPAKEQATRLPPGLAPGNPEENPEQA